MVSLEGLLPFYPINFYFAILAMLKENAVTVDNACKHMRAAACFEKVRMLPQSRFDVTNVTEVCTKLAVNICFVIRVSVGESIHASRHIRSDNLMPLFFRMTGAAKMTILSIKHPVYISILRAINVVPVVGKGCGAVSGVKLRSVIHM